MNISTVILAAVIVFVAFFMIRIMNRVPRWFQDRLMRARAASSYAGDRTPDGPAKGRFSYVESERPAGIVFSVVGLVGLCTMWLVLPKWFPSVDLPLEVRIGLTILCAFFWLAGLPGAFRGRSWRCRIENGRLSWQCPSQRYGENDSCSVQDIVELERIVRGSNSSVGGDFSEYYLLLQGGTRKSIQEQCFGNYAEFFRALKQANPRIVIREKFE